MAVSTILLEKILRFLDRLARERFYGVIELHFENGRIFRMRKLHSIESEELENLISS